MKLLLLFLLATVFLALTCTAADRDNLETFGLKNGRFWNEIPKEARSLFLLGIFDGWELRGHSENEIPGKVLLALSGPHVPMGELAEMLDEAYSHPENRSLPVGWVVLADRAIQRGETTPDLVFPALRKQLAERLAGTVSGDAISPIDTIRSVQTKSQH